MFDLGERSWMLWTMCSLELPCLGKGSPSIVGNDSSVSIKQIMSECVIQIVKRVRPDVLI